MNGIRIDLDPSMTRVIVIGLLIMAEAFFVPLYACLQGGNFPTALELATWAANAIIQEITYWMVFLKTGEEKKEETP